MKTPRIALFDIETAPSKGWVWALHETDVIEVDQDWYILSFAHRWLGQQRTHFHGLPDYKTFKTNKIDDRLLCQDMWTMFNEADIVIGHNVDRFDVRKANARFLKNGFPPVKPYKTIDTLKIARRYFKFDSNRLNDLAKFLGIGAKLPHQGFKLWKDCMNGDPAAWNIMERYNKHDIWLLDKVYEKLRPFAVTHPNLPLYTGEYNGDGVACHNCASTNVTREGIFTTLSRRYAQYKCLDCGHYFRKQRSLKHGEK